MTLGLAATTTQHVDAPPPLRPRRLDYAAWLCEALGTAAMLFTGFCAVAVVNAHRSPLRRDIPSAGVRYALIGVVFGLAVAAVVASPLGRRSGAHLNPAVTLALWLRHKIPTGDAIGYLAAQCLGATGTAGAFTAVWGPWAAEVHGGRTRPAYGISPLVAACIELLLTFGLVLAVLVFADSPSLQRWAPVAFGAAVAFLVWAGAATSGASFNPARTLGPAIVGGDFTDLWVYLAGPLAGSALATAVYTWRPRITDAAGRADAAAPAPV